MPLYDVVCDYCGTEKEVLLFGDETAACPNGCGEMTKLPSTAAFRIKGLRAANGYGLTSIDTYGKCKVTGLESGYSYSDSKGNSNYDARNKGGEE